jgi:hypothetical protein
MSEKVINFSALKRKEVKALIYTEKGEVKIEYNQDKIKELQGKMENPILIYNINDNQRLEMEKILADKMDRYIKDKEI